MRLLAAYWLERCSEDWSDWSILQSHQLHIGNETMTYNEQKLELDPELIILGLGYATSLIVAIGWVASLVL